MLLQERQGAPLGLGGIHIARLHARGKPRFTVGSGTPRIHPLEQAIRLLDRDHRPFGDNIELGIGDQGGHLDDPLPVRVEAGHLQVDPDQTLAAGVLLVVFH